MMNSKNSVTKLYSNGAPLLAWGVMTRLIKIN